MSTIEKALARKAAKQSLEKSAESSEQAATTNNDPISHSNDSSSEVAQDRIVLTVDTTSLSARGYLIDTGERKSIKDEFRQIKRKLLNNAFGSGAKLLHHPNLIMVSSAKPNEGKTFVSVNLALSIALEQDKKVLLIDADVLRPSVNRELGLENTEGLIEYLLQPEKQVSDVLFDTNINNLKVMPAGQPHHLSNELLASERMAALATELATRYPDRVVIFDCPPLIGVTETLVLANLVGQAIVVVEESKTTIASIKAATESLNEDLALGIVMNKAIRSHKDLYGYYGYGYGEKE
ncbi:XrtA-associated tyrosine autokinase [Thalassotalea castellviae]|uniref:non-specific protein-tyrosine kinase n=1 Tax=Thalassotalea castellviae TaxID=3075612 RepID=A0ABU3A0W4_9GAMM|nr:XrtA-associated tyrosine autokinase [Thalassotalea sp. W431]MDT0603820.1 XrtA-associated tyrosine autokinase [Thalassotalea sp. W431]